MQDKTIITLYGMTLISGLEGFAISCGIDGVMLITVIGGLFLAIGIVIPQPGFLKRVET